MIYHVGIIDFLTPWTPRKKVENFTKSKMVMKNQAKISCVNPDLFQRRFVEFIKREMLYKHRETSRKLPSI